MYNQYQNTYRFNNLVFKFNSYIKLYKYQESISLENISILTASNNKVLVSPLGIFFSSYKKWNQFGEGKQLSCVSSQLSFRFNPSVFNCLVSFLWQNSNTLNCSDALELLF